jgi:hypothetical protein
MRRRRPQVDRGPTSPVRIDRDLAVLDPAARTGPWDGNVIAASISG